MTREEMLEAIPLLQEKARRTLPKDFSKFIQYINPSYEIPDFQKRIARKCQDVVEGKIKRLMIFVPPQHGKSEIATRLLPAWILGRDPSKKIVIASYSADLATSFCKDTQRIIQGQPFMDIFGGNLIGLKGLVTNADYFETKKGGFDKAVGVGGSLTGRPADIAIIDDPVKGAKEAYSETFRNNAWEWWLNVLETRLHNDSGVIIIQTRWHQDDLSGRILEKEPGRWEALSLPAIKEDDTDPEDTRAVGEPLWPERHDLESLLRIKELSERTFASLYQQRPSIEGGNIIKSDWFKFISLEDFTRERENHPVHFFIDTAFTDDTKNDPTGLLSACLMGNNIYITHAKKVLMKFPDLIRFVPKYAYDHDYSPGRSSIRIEPKANGISVVHQLQESTGLNVTQTPSPTESKETRLNVNSTVVECGRVVLVEGSWNDEFITEVCGFPNVKHDEFVDLLCYAIDYFNSKTTGLSISQLSNYLR